MIFAIMCRIDNGATIFYRKCVVKAPDETEARNIVQNHYAPGYDDVCHILSYEVYELRDGVVLEM